MAIPLIVEELSKIEISSDGKLYLYLGSRGNLSYQYVYRAGAGVYWDGHKKAFLFDLRNEAEVTKWYIHVVNIAESELRISLRVNEDTSWINFPVEVRDEIQRIVIEHAVLPVCNRK